MSDIIEHQVIEIGSNRRVVRTVYRDCSPPGPGSWIIYQGGWKQVKLTVGNKYLLLTRKETK